MDISNIRREIRNSEVISYRAVIDGVEWWIPNKTENRFYNEIVNGLRRADRPVIDVQLSDNGLPI